MNKNIFFISIIMIFSIFDAAQASHGRKKHSWVTQEELEFHAVLKNMSVDRALIAYGYTHTDFSTLNKEQKDYIYEILDNYGITIAEKKLDRMVFSTSDCIATGYMPATHAIVLSPEMNPGFCERIDLQVFDLLTNLCMFDNTVKHPVAVLEREATRTDIVALHKMQCVPCIKNVSEHFRRAEYDELFASRGHIIHDLGQVQKVIYDFPSRNPQCKSCQRLSTDKVWVELK